MSHEAKLKPRLQASPHTSEAVSLRGSKYHDVLRFQGFDLIGRLVNAKRVSRLKEQRTIMY